MRCPSDDVLGVELDGQTPEWSRTTPWLHRVVLGERVGERRHERTLPRTYVPIVVNRGWLCSPTVVTTEDRMIAPALQRTMAQRIAATSSEVSGSHAIYVSQPSVVASVIAQAAQNERGAATVA